MNVSEVAEQLADAVRDIPSLYGRTYAFPPASIVPPAAIIPFPEVEFDINLARGADEIDVAIVVLIGTAHDAAAWAEVLPYMDGDGPQSIKAAVEAGTYTAFDSVRVTGATVEEYVIGDIPHLAAIFPLDIIGSGTT